MTKMLLFEIGFKRTKTYRRIKICLRNLLMNLKDLVVVTFLFLLLIISSNFLVIAEIQGTKRASCLHLRSEMNNCVFVHRILISMTILISTVRYSMFNSLIVRHTMERSDPLWFKPITIY